MLFIYKRKLNKYNISSWILVHVIKYLIGTSGNFMTKSVELGFVGRKFVKDPGSIYKRFFF